ncbi:hypothetical protein CPB84DRAFT_1747911 [Gymnopilus junonius]|uniref:Glyoxalase-like domain-containing protein n=1 Tax=Gymnopilus junonius TaxID=109634 RepID=A0A9P5TLK5_GYMJU|nr:hypothetical protein CPB84DRAFT_1747911 [Gymnopilus junonius]
MSINTQTLDHIVHLTPPGSVQEVSKQFRELGFQVLPGGTHTDKLTQNALVNSYTSIQPGLPRRRLPRTHLLRPPPLLLPPGHTSTPRPRRASMGPPAPGWIDFAFLGNGSLLPPQSISKLINHRSKTEGSGIAYDLEVEQGRVRTDGPSGEGRREEGRGALFLWDVKPSSRKLRVPSDPPSNTTHPSSALGIAYVRVLVNTSSFAQVSKQLISVVGKKPTSISESPSPKKAVWDLDTVNLDVKKKRSQLVLSTPDGEEEEAFVKSAGIEAGAGKGIYEVAFFVKSDRVPRSRATPYGKISWVKSE